MSDRAGQAWKEPFSVCPWLCGPPERKCCSRNKDEQSACGCIENGHEMCGVCCCCCCMFADNQMRAGLLGGADSGNLAQVRDTFAREFFLRAVLCCPLGRCGYYARARNAFRHKVGGQQPLKGSSCFLTWCCGCCTMVQEKRELDRRALPGTRSVWYCGGVPLPPDSEHSFCCLGQLGQIVPGAGRSAAPSVAPLPPPELKTNRKKQKDQQGGPEQQEMSQI